MLNEIQVIDKEEVYPVIKYADELEIASPEGMLEATDILTSLNTWNDSIEEDRLKLTKPLNESLKGINAKYKPYKDLLTNAIASVRLKMGSYQSQVISAQKEAEEALARCVGEGRGHLKMETAIRKMDEVEKAEKNIEGAEGSVVFVEVEKFEVEAFNLLPDLYKIPNDTAIREAMKRGVHVEGVRYWTEQSVRNTR